MDKAKPTSALLETMFYRMFINYSLSMIFVTILLFIINTLRYFQFANYEPIKYPYSNIVLERIVGIFAYSVLLILVYKCRSSRLITIIYMTLPIVSFEFNSYMLSYWESYISYALFYNSFREIILLNINITATYANELLVITYHIIRAFLFKHYDVDFPIFTFIGYLMLYIFINFPILGNYIRIKQTIVENDELKRDFELIILALPIPVFQLDLHKQHIVMANQEFNRIISKTSEFASDREFIKLFIEKGNFAQHESTAQQGQLMMQIRSTEYLFIFKLLEQNNGETYIVCAQDMSTAKEMESLKAKQVYKNMFISVINHQLRTPLNGISAPLNIIKDKCNTEIAEYMELALYSLSILSSLIDDTIAFSDCENGKMKVNMKECNLIAELEQLKKMYQFESTHKLIPLNFDVVLSHQYVMLDIKKLRQILIILISNAFKYTFNGSIQVICKEEANSLVLTVSDTGIGIKSEYLPNLFKEFNSPERVNSEKLTSSGFQLSLVSKFVSLMSGSISVASKYGKGTKFDIKLQYQKVTRFSSTISLIHEKPTSKNLDSYNIAPSVSTQSKVTNVLVVDDNAANVFVLQKMLGLLSITSDKAMNGMECLAKVVDKGLYGYSLILMDINMPVMNGLDAAKAINKLVFEGKVNKCIIIAVTAQDEEGMLEQCNGVGIEKCLFKPVKMTELRTVLEKLSESTLAG